MDERERTELIELITKLVIKELNGTDASIGALDTAGTGRQAHASNDKKEVIIGVGPAFMTVINRTINGLPLADVLREIKAGIEEEGMTSRVIKVYKTSDVSFIGREAAGLSGSGISVGLQSKGTAIIHQRGLYPLTNLELFPQAPLLTLEHYRKLGKNAAKYVKGEKVVPVEVMNDPMVRAAYQVKAALMHIKETELVDRSKASEEFDYAKGVGAV